MKTLYSFLVVALLSASSVLATTPTFNHVLGFDATNAASYVDCGVQPDYTPAAYTVELWAYITGSVGTPTLISNGSTPAGAFQGFTLRVNSTTKAVEATVGVGTFINCILTGSTPIVYGTWNHIALVVDGVNVTTYLNGVLNVTVPFPAGKTLVTSTTKLYMGSHPSFTGRQMTGQLSDVRFWNIARSQADIQSTMNDFLTGNEPGLLANWKLDDTDGTTTVHDLKGIFNATRGDGTAWITNSTKINEVSATNINVWPSVLNAGEMLNVEFDSNSTVRIFTAQGKVVKNTIVQGEGNLKKIDTSNLKSGMYLLNIISNEKNQIAKFVVR